jgi:hypothetical protein
VVPFVRFSRDRRGYESVYLMHVVAGPAGPPRPCVLYCFRTPPGVKVGRLPFDEEARRALEARYPELTFDWKRISEAQPPVIAEEPWRERRRVERAMKQARAGERRKTTDEPAPRSTSGRSADAALTAVEAVGPGTDGETTPAGAVAGTRRKRRRRRGRPQNAGADGPVQPDAAAGLGGEAPVEPIQSAVPAPADQAAESPAETS